MSQPDSKIQQGDQVKEYDDQDSQASDVEEDAVAADELDTYNKSGGTDNQQQEDDDDEDGEDYNNRGDSNGSDNDERNEQQSGGEEYSNKVDNSAAGGNDANQQQQQQQNNNQQPMQGTGGGEEDRTSATNLIINYLPQDMTDRELYSLFSSCGSINTCKIMRDYKTGYSFGYGFVDYNAEADSETAIQKLNGYYVRNKRLKVSYARPGGQSIKDTNLYVINLPRSINDEQLDRIFSPYGRIVQRNILRDKLTGRPRGVAFVRYNKREEAQGAIQALNNTIPEGGTQPISVRLAEEHGKAKAAQFMSHGGHGGGHHMGQQPHHHPHQQQHQQHLHQQQHQHHQQQHLHHHNLPPPHHMQHMHGGGGIAGVPPPMHGGGGYHHNMAHRAASHR
ncbi:sex-lethal homolog isoform X2 [Scaptodrosophila lebanonensis]|uniref:Protein sex-lethal n=1 Tax=Drosophila lebanonensis TaxID=7225 RepID=A0A6J2U303_DROLE|nr:sex-lethal homolog isoform X2 [Scaptodrosophila lebanonensis]